jgi:hypothetical protein
VGEEEERWRPEWRKKVQNWRKNDEGNQFWLGTGCSQEYLYLDQTGRAPGTIFPNLHVTKSKRSQIISILKSLRVGSVLEQCEAEQA